MNLNFSSCNKSEQSVIFYPVFYDILVVSIDNLETFYHFEDYENYQANNTEYSFNMINHEMKPPSAVLHKILTKIQGKKRTRRSAQQKYQRSKIFAKLKSKHGHDEACRMICLMAEWMKAEDVTITQRVEEIESRRGNFYLVIILSIRY